jgi:hypothetical protein
MYGEGLITNPFSNHSLGRSERHFLGVPGKDYIKTVMYGRQDLPPKVRSIRDKIGNEEIKGMQAARIPLMDMWSNILNVLSVGEFKKRLATMPYDKLFHLMLILDYGGKKYSLEKNEVINMTLNPVLKEGSEYMTIQIPKGLTLNMLLENGSKYMGDKWLRYSAYNNNCQDFIIAVLRSSNLGNDTVYNFVKQDTKSLFDPSLRKIANTITDLGAKVNEITTGAGIGSGVVQSVLFARPKWTKAKASKWIKEHGYKIDYGIDAKPEHLRYRQVDPDEMEEEGYIFRTKKIGDDIELVIGYKDMAIGRNISMPRRRVYESDSSSDEYDSASDSEDEILRSMEGLRHRISRHHDMKGGKINIAKSLKKLGSTIKKGFEKEVAQPIKKEAYQIGDTIKDTAKREAYALGDTIKDTAKKEAYKVGDLIKEKTYDKVSAPATKFGKRAGKYITAKRGGLASDLLHTGVPLVTGALTGAAATALVPQGGPMSGLVGSQLGKFAASKMTDYIGEKTGVGLRKRRGKGDLLHIDIDSHNSRGKSNSSMSGDGFTHAGKSSLQQLIAASKDKEEKAIRKALLEQSKDIKAIKSFVGAGFVKGSPEAKEKMARIRAMRKK